MKRKLKVVVERGEDHGFVAHVPELPGCWSQGKTIKEAASNITEAAKAWLEAERDKPEGGFAPVLV
jgi:predicted RNase H-like HicB family nuclease